MDVLGGLFSAFQGILLRVVLIIIGVAVFCLVAGYFIGHCGAHP